MPIFICSVRVACAARAQVEIREALRLHKKVVLVADEESPLDGYGGHLSFGEYIADAIAGDALLVGGATGTTRSVFDHNVAIPY